MKILNKLCCSFLITILLSGCAIFREYSEKTAKEKALISVEIVNSWYYQTYQHLQIMYEKYPEHKEILIKANKIMNDLKEKILTYNELVNIWIKLDIKDKKIDEIAKEIEKSILEVIEILEKFQKEK